MQHVTLRAVAILFTSSASVSKIDVAEFEIGRAEDLVVSAAAK